MFNKYTQPRETTSYQESHNERPHFSKFWPKIAFIFTITITLLFTGIIMIRKVYFSRTTDQEIILETNYQRSVWKDYGEVFEPIIEIPIYHTQGGYKPEKFLIDSGALVSSLPREKAEPLGFSLAMLPRSTFKGFGNSTTFAYRADINALFGEKKVSIPVVFTEATGSKSILGRTGFFENYSITFNSKEQKIQIRN
jgi:hypothetical protein